MDEELQLTISCDTNVRLLEGEKKYKLHLPLDIPASVFWSIIVYDTLSNFIIHTDQPWPSVFSNEKNLACNNDGSIDVWFGPEPTNGKESNWIKTKPGKRWYMIL